MRVEQGGHWAEVSEEPFGWRPKNRIRDAAASGGFYDSFSLALVTDRVKAWDLPGDPSTPEAWESVPDAFGDMVLQACLKVWAGAPDPNSTSGDGSNSSPSPQGSESETPTAS